MDSPVVEVFRGTHSDAPHAAPHHSSYETSIDNLCLDWFSEGVRLGRQLQRDEHDERLARYKTRMRAQAIKYEQEVLLRKRYCDEMEFLKAELFALKDELLATHAAYEELALSGVTMSNSGVLEEGGPHLNLSSATLPQRRDFANEASVPLEDFYDFQQCMDDDIDGDHLMDNTDQSRSSIESDDSSSTYSDPESPPSDISTHSHQTLCKSDDVSEIASLMSAAHEGDSIALQSVRAHIRVAERTPRRQRTPAQTHLLVHWSNRTPATATLQPSPEGPEIFVDASAYGIGFIFNDRWLAWRFTTSHPLLPLGPDGRLVISWAELVAVELGIRTLIVAGFRNVTVTVRSDNQGVVVALESEKWTQKYGLNEIVKRILHLSRKAGLSLKIKWISTKENPADNPSRGVYSPAELSFHCRPPIPRTLSDLIQEVE